MSSWDERPPRGLDADDHRRLLIDDERTLRERSAWAALLGAGVAGMLTVLVHSAIGWRTAGGDGTRLFASAWDVWAAASFGCVAVVAISSRLQAVPRRFTAPAAYVAGRAIVAGGAVVAVDAVIVQLVLMHWLLDLPGVDPLLVVAQLVAAGVAVAGGERLRAHGRRTALGSS